MQQQAEPLLPSAQKALPTWHKPYKASVRELQVPATIAMLLCLGLAALLPAVEYATILRADANTSLASPAAIWAGCALSATLGVAAYRTLSPLLLGAHAALTCIAGSAMVVAFTMVYFDADARCHVSQAVLQGCSACACAAASACEAADLGSNTDDAACEVCTAWGADTCAAVLATGGIASWGGIVMAPLLATVAAASLLLSQRVASQKQALAQMLAECRQDVAGAHRTLQATGRTAGMAVADVRAALTMLWESGDTDAASEAREFVALAQSKGIVLFDNVVPPGHSAPAAVSPTPSLLRAASATRVAPAPGGVDSGASVSLDMRVLSADRAITAAALPAVASLHMAQPPPPPPPQRTARTQLWGAARHAEPSKVPKDVALLTDDEVLLLDDDTGGDAATADRGYRALEGEIEDPLPEAAQAGSARDRAQGAGKGEKKDKRARKEKGPPPVDAEVSAKEERAERKKEKHAKREKEGRKDKSRHKSDRQDAEAEGGEGRGEKEGRRQEAKGASDDGKDAKAKKEKKDKRGKERRKKDDSS